MRSKAYAAINIFCLSVGITGALLIALLINDEYSYDRHHANYDDIYRVEGHYTLGGGTDHLAITPTPLGPALKNEFSNIKAYTRFQQIANLDVRTQSAEFIENDFWYADSTVFDVFTHRFIYGQPSSALSQPRTIVLTHTLSEKYFGTQNPVGQTIRANNTPYTITGVIEDVPYNSHMRFDALISFSTLDHAYSVSPDLFWSINVTYTYLLLFPDVAIESITGNLENFYSLYTEPAGKLLSARAEFTATPLKETRFKSILMSPPIANRTTLMVLGVVAIFLVIIAAVNYTNLATARAGVRAREIGIRKVSGATSFQIRRQFLAESVLTAFLALLLSLLLIEILLPGFNTLAGKNFTAMNLLEGKILLQAIAITLISGLLAGFYPAVYLSRMSPVQILRSSGNSQTGPAALRKSLVAFQFAISIMLIAGTLTVSDQLSYIYNRDKGIQINNRMVLSLHAINDESRLETIETKLLESPYILGTTKSSSFPGGGYNTIAIQAQVEAGLFEGKITSNIVDHKFLELYNISLLEGRNFDDDLPSERGAAAIINQSAVEYFGWHENPIGKLISWQFNPDGTPQRHVRVIGVMKDHNYLDLTNPITPFMVQLYDADLDYNYISIHYDEGKVQEAVAHTEATLRSLEPDIIPNIYFPGENYRDAFSYQEKLGKIFAVFALVCIIVSFLGLYGLSSFMTRQRSREVGIRKVLGSSGWSILVLFLKEFGLLILISIVIAAPVSWLLLEQWLDTFFYRINQGASPYLIAAAIAITITIVTVSYHTFIASRKNPVDAIRTE